MPTYEIPAPLIIPIANPGASVASKAAGMFASLPSNSDEEMQTLRESTEPTERSIPSPPAITTRDCPRATIPRNTERRSTLMRWLTLRKPGEMTSPRMKSAMIAATAMASRE
jgi:hypothetical protein